jgi:uncharacterized protein YbjT (DUF2867 family)
MPHEVFVTGASGYIGRSLIEALHARSHGVRALVRLGSEKRLPRGAVPVLGNALDAVSYRNAVTPADTFVHLVGTPHPSPAKAKQFREVDLVSIRAAVDAAVHAKVRHFVYLSVAHPAPVMAAYIEVRKAGEALVAASGMAATFVRPWYVLGPGHRWPLLVLPAYWLMKRLPATRETAMRLGLVTLEQLVGALVQAVERPPADVRVLNVPDIRASITKEVRA